MVFLKKRFLPVLFIVTFFCGDAVADINHLLPKPKSVTLTGEAVALKGFRTTESNMPELFTDLPQSESGLPVNITFVDSIPGAYDYPLYGYQNEAYNLKITSNEVAISAVSEIGALRSIQTLAQIAEGTDSLPCVEITDWPAFKLRGYMHDVGRSYIPVDDLVKHIKLLSRFKINTFHWHLTENQAWRLQIDAYPQLTADSTMTRLPGKYYTADDVAKVMQAARRHGVVVIPEIDMPGHSAAFERAMGFEMQSEQGMAVLKDVLREVADMFRGVPYIHIGADEKEIHNAKFLPEMVEFVHSLGYKVICWNPIHGVKITADAGFDMTQMWSTAGKLVPGVPNIDCRYNYTNHFDVFADLVGIYKSNIYYAERGNAEIAGSISAAWNDRQLPTSDDIILQNNFYPNVLATAERAWVGGGKEYIEKGGVTLPIEGEELDEFVDFERRLLYHKDHSLKGEPLAYMRQTDILWHITIDDIIEYIARGAGIYLRHTWGSIVPALVEEPKLGMKATARTFVYSPKEQTAGAVVELQNYSRSEKDLAPDAGKWDRKGSKVFINGEELLPAKWDNSGVEINNETFLQNENFTARKPLPVTLKKGWNEVELQLPYAPAEGVRLNKWMFTFMLTDIEGRNALSHIFYTPILKK